MGDDNTLNHCYGGLYRASEPGDESNSNEPVLESESEDDSEEESFYQKSGIKTTEILPIPNKTNIQNISYGVAGEEDDEENSEDESDEEVNENKNSKDSPKLHPRATNFFKQPENEKTYFTSPRMRKITSNEPVNIENISYGVSPLDEAENISYGVSETESNISYSNSSAPPQVSKSENIIQKKTSPFEEVSYSTDDNPKTLITSNSTTGKSKRKSVTKSLKNDSIYAPFSSKKAKIKIPKPKFSSYDTADHLEEKLEKKKEKSVRKSRSKSTNNNNNNNNEEIKKKRKNKELDGEENNENESLKGLPRRRNFNWNSEFQEAVDLPEGKEKWEKLAHLARDFVYCSKTYGKIIISEYYLPEEEKTIKSCDAGGLPLFKINYHY